MAPKTDGNGDKLPDDALFASSPEAIEKAYESHGPPVPIVVEYRRIRHAQIAPPEPLDWSQR